MIDLHCHLLPGLDDGAASDQDTSSMLAAAAAAGVGTIAATSHARSNAERYDRVFGRWQETAAKTGITLVPGLEYDWTNLVEIRRRGGEESLRYLGAGALLVDFCLGNGMLPSDWTMLLKWSKAQQLKRVVAVHPERLFRDPVSACRTLADAGVLIQVNAGSLTGGFGRRVRRSAELLLDAGLCHFVAGDQHRPGTGWLLAEARERLLRRYSAECVSAWVETNPAAILSGAPVRLVRPRISPVRRWLAKVLP